MSDTTPGQIGLQDAEAAIRKLATDGWFDGLTIDWQRFLVANTLETYRQYDITLDQAAQKLIEFYVETIQTYPGAETMNPWEEMLPAGGGGS